MSFIDQMAANTTESKNVILAIKRAPEPTWAGKAMAETTSKEVREIAPQKVTAREALKVMLKA